MSRLVALILETSAIGLVERLGRQIPIWIADTPAHEVLQQRASKRGWSHRWTWFALRNGESLEDGAIRIAYSLDQHYDESSQDVAYDTLWVWGVPCSEKLQQRLGDLGFQEFEAAWNGFIAVKRQAIP